VIFCSLRSRCAQTAASKEAAVIRSVLGQQIVGEFMKVRDAADMAAAATKWSQSAISSFSSPMFFGVTFDKGVARAGCHTIFRRGHTC